MSYGMVVCLMRRAEPALLGPYCPLFARKFANASAPHTLHALLGLLIKEQADIMHALSGAHDGPPKAGCAPEGVGLAGRRRAMASGAVRIGKGAREPSRGSGQGHKPYSNAGAARIAARRPRRMMEQKAPLV